MVETKTKRAISPAWFATGAIVFLVTSFLLLFPLAIGGDYPNHLARTHIEGWLATSTALQEYFALRLDFIPDLTMDMIIPWMSHLIGTYKAGALVCVAAIVIGPIGGILFSKRRHGDASAWLPFLGFATTFNMNLEFGFINYIVGSGLALIAFCFWSTIQPGLKRTVCFALVGLFLTLNHAFGFLLFGYMVLLWEIAKFSFKERGSAANFLNGLILRDGWAFLPGLLFILVSVLGASDLEKALPTENIFGQRDVATLAPFRFYTSSNSVITAYVSIISISVGIFVGLWRRVIEIDKDMAVVCAGLGILALAMPVSFMGIWGLYFRFGVVFFIVLAASIRFRQPNAELSAVVGVAIGGLIVLQVMNAAPNLVRTADQFETVRATFSHLPKGARVLPVSDGVADQIFAHHAVSLAVIEADAFVPNLFTNTSPVDVRDAYKHLHSPQGIPITADALKEGLNKSLPKAENGHWTRDFYFSWPNSFTHILFVRADAQKSLDFQELCLIKESENHALYEIKSDPRGLCQGG